MKKEPTSYPWMLRILQNARSSVHSAGANRHHGGRRSLLCHPRILHCDLFVRCRAHEGPFAKPAPSPGISLEKAFRQLQIPAQASVQQSALWYLHVPGQLGYCTAQHVDGCGKLVAAFFECEKYISWKSAEDGAIDEVLQVKSRKNQQNPDQYHDSMNMEYNHHWASVEHYCCHFFTSQIPLLLAQLATLLQISDDSAVPHVLWRADSMLHYDLPLLAWGRDKVVVGCGELQLRPCFRTVLCFHTVEELGIRWTCIMQCRDSDSWYYGKPPSFKTRKSVSLYSGIRLFAIYLKSGKKSKLGKYGL